MLISAASGILCSSKKMARWQQENVRVKVETEMSRINVSNNDFLFPY